MLISEGAIEIALYNMDQLLPDPPAYPDSPVGRAYQAGLRRGVVEALSMVLNRPNEVNEIWNNVPLTYKRGNYGRSPNE